MVKCFGLDGLIEEMERVAPYPGYGVKIVVQLFLTYFFFCKALAYSMVMDSYYPIQKGLLGTPAEEATDKYTVVRAPWAMKPIWAIISDVFPICGYRKRYYILISIVLALVGILSQIFIKPLPENAANQTAFNFFLFVAGTTMCDSMSQARYTELMKASKSVTVVSFVWFALNLGGLFSFYNQLLPSAKEEEEGGLPEWRYLILMYIAIPLCVPMLLPAAANWLAEEPGPAGCSMNIGTVLKHRKIFILSVCTATFALGGVGVQFSSWGEKVELWGIEARWRNGFYYCGASIGLLVLCQLCFPPAIALPSVYMFICKALYLNVGVFLQYWYTAPKECFDLAPNFDLGPRFENKYYQTVSGYGGTIASLLGVVVFDRTIRYWNVRKAFWLTTAVNAATTIFELMIIERWNQKLFGYDPNVNPSRLIDQLFFIFGANAIDRLLDMLDAMPQTVLIGKLCPKGMEAQVFAILAALSNFGSNVAYTNGAIAAQIFGVKLNPATADKDCDFNNPPGALGISNLGWLKLCATCFLPLATVPFTWCFLPNINLSDDFVDKPEDSTEMQEGASQSFTIAGQNTNTAGPGDEKLWADAGRVSVLRQGASRDMLM